MHTLHAGLLCRSVRRFSDSVRGSRLGAHALRRIEEFVSSQRALRAANAVLTGGKCALRKQFLYVIFPMIRMYVCVCTYVCCFGPRWENAHYVGSFVRYLYCILDVCMYVFMYVCMYVMYVLLLRPKLCHLAGNVHDVSRLPFCLISDNLSVLWSCCTRPVAYVLWFIILLHTCYGL
jgi:hypothetical protein